MEDPDESPLPLLGLSSPMEGKKTGENEGEWSAYKLSKEKMTAGAQAADRSACVEVQ